MTDRAILGSFRSFRPATEHGRFALAGAPAGELVVFKPEDNRLPPNEYENATNRTEPLARQHSTQPDDLGIMGRFFEDCYSNADLDSRFQHPRRQANFQTLSDDFEMTSSRAQDILVPFEQGKLLTAELFKTGQLTTDLRRRFQRYTVGLQPWEFQRAKGGAVFESSAGSDIWIAADPAYDLVAGLTLSLGSEEFVL